MVIIDLHSYTTIKKIKTGYLPVRVAIFDNGNFAAVTNSVSGTVQTIDLNTLKITNTFSTSVFRSSRTWLGSILPVPITIIVRNDQETAYISNYFADIISLIDLKSGKILKTFEAGRGPDGMAIINI